MGEPESIQQKNTWQTLKKQERIIHVGDTTGTTRVAMWENDVGGLTIEKSYKITDMTVRIQLYKEIKYLSASQKCKLEEDGDIGDIAEMRMKTSKPQKSLQAALIKVVVSCEDYTCCMNCSAKKNPQHSTL